MTEENRRSREYHASLRKRYGVIYAYYDCMELDDLRSLNIESKAAQDSVLLLWVTDPMLKSGIALMEAWGYTYKTVGFYWAKINDGVQFMGNGYWTRANPEQCLLGTRGHPSRLNADVRKLVISPRREHSQKPDEIYERIERLCAGPYLELFARQRWDG